MPTSNEHTFTGEGGYVDTAAPDSMEGYMAPGSEGLYPDGAGMLRSYKDPSSTGIASVAQAALVGTLPGGIAGTGSIFADRSAPAAATGKKVYIGSGNTNYNGTSGPAATTAISMADLTDTATDFTLGITPPSAPTVASVSGGTKTDGSYSFKICYKRTITNGVSAPSVATAPLVIPSGNRAELTIRRPPVGSEIDYVQIFRTVANFATLGPWFLVRSLAVTPEPDATPAYVTEYVDVYDSDLLAVVPPIGYEMPPVGTHAFRLGGYLCVATAIGSACCPPTDGGECHHNKRKRANQQ